MLFLILSFLEIGADRRQKSISVEFSFAIVFAKSIKLPLLNDVTSDYVSTKVSIIKWV